MPGPDYQVVSTNPTDTTYFCLSARDGSLSQPWCLVDRSSGGARLLVDNPAHVPDTFTLVQKGPVVTLWKCRVAWRAESHIGGTLERNQTGPACTPGRPAAAVECR